MGQKEWAARLPVAKSKAELVYDNLHTAIVGGALRPGERINMDELARNLGVSKIPIREAVKRLQSEGLVVSRVHSGVMVAEIDQKEIHGVFLAREAIEGLVGRLAVDNVSAKLLADLQRVQRSMRKQLDKGEVESLPELNADFHRILAEASGYRILVELTEQLLLTVRRYRLVSPTDEQAWWTVVDEHDAIIEALRGSDAEGVAEAVRAHTVSQASREGTSSE
ncbi:GntR family transcriptional regulator [Streptomyces sp. bgisy100]|uniref:GntR family transcriptional regulator n=1 Tax=Streptomyces sp. bgisy100 TaxID=3413783 RepID=UPI003D756989